MKLSVLLPIKNFQGIQIKTTDGLPATFRHVTVDALMNQQPDDPRDGGAFQFKCFSLAMRIQEQTVLETNVEELAFLKKRVGNSQFLNNLVIGRVFEIIEGAGRLSDVLEDVCEGAATSQKG